jgi:hypothetical protein
MDKEEDKKAKEGKTKVNVKADPQCVISRCK